MWRDRDRYPEHNMVPDTFWLVAAALLFAACGLVWRALLSSEFSTRVWLASMRSSRPTGSIRRRISGLIAQAGALNALSTRNLTAFSCLARGIN